jgi:putative aldouronate transport system permease protein
VPFVNSISISLSSKAEQLKAPIGLLPRGFTIEAYVKLIMNSQFLRTAMNTLFLTALNTSLVIVISLAAGYALSSKYLPGRKAMMTYFMIPMYFSGGLIPSYMLIQGIGLNNSFGALIFPAIVNIFYIIVFRNMISQLPKELNESAEIDGAGQPTILFKIIIPLIIPTIAAFIVFSAVQYWNEWFGCLLYIRDKEKWTLQYQLREILISAQLSSELEKNMADKSEVYSESLKMAALMISILPIIAIYPFVQKYFMSGVLVGAVKG